MKIICENMDEYDALMRASKYLHDFQVDVGGWRNVFNKEVVFLNLNLEMINFLSHLYLTTDDFPDKFDVIKIEGVDNDQGN